VHLLRGIGAAPPTCDRQEVAELTRICTPQLRELDGRVLGTATRVPHHVRGAAHVRGVCGGADHACVFVCAKCSCVAVRTMRWRTLGTHEHTQTHHAMANMPSLALIQLPP
jgi:hypothetical protein